MCDSDSLQTVKRDTCSTCRFYEVIGQSIARCRRFPAYQSRSPDQWCGEFQPKESSRQKKQKPATQSKKSRKRKK